MSWSSQLVPRSQPAHPTDRAKERPWAKAKRFLFEKLNMEDTGANTAPASASVVEDSENDTHLPPRQPASPARCLGLRSLFHVLSQHIQLKKERRIRWVGIMPNLSSDAMLIWFHHLPADITWTPKMTRIYRPVNQLVQLDVLVFAACSTFSASTSNCLEANKKKERRIRWVGIMPNLSSDAMLIWFHHLPGTHSRKIEEENAVNPLGEWKQATRKDRGLLCKRKRTGWASMYIVYST
jgi:uncharacterized membrane protein SirB2